MKTIDKYYELVGEYPSIEELFVFRQFLRLRPDEEAENKNYNPNRDPDGRFGSGASGSTATGKGSYKPTAEYVSKFNGFQSKQTSDFSRAYQAEYSFKKAGIKGKPTKVDTLSEDSQVVHRGWDDQKHLSEFTDTEQSRLSWGLNGSGVYFSTQEKTASNYGNLVTTMGIKKDAKGVDYEVIRRKADIDHKRLNSQIESMRLDAQLTVDPKQRVKMRLESDELERTSDNMHLDLGVYAALNGYDYISDKDTSFYLILDKSKLEYTQ